MFYKDEGENCLRTNKEAALCNKYLNKHAEQLNGTLKQRQRKAKEQIWLSFFNDLSDDSFSFCQRIDLKEQNVGECRSLLLCGTDFMTEENVAEYFRPFCVTIVHVDSSHCFVQFESQIQCLMALETNRKNKNENDAVYLEKLRSGEWT